MVDGIATLAAHTSLESLDNGWIVLGFELGGGRIWVPSADLERGVVPGVARERVERQGGVGSQTLSPTPSWFVPRKPKTPAVHPENVSRNPAVALLELRLHAGEIEFPRNIFQ